MDQIMQYIFNALPGLGLVVIAAIVLYLLFRAQIATFKDANGELRSDIERIRSESRETREQFKEIKDINVRLEAQVRELKSRTDAYEKRVTELQNIVRTLQETFTPTFEQIDYLASAMATVSEQVQSLEQFDPSVFAELRSRLRDHGVRLVNLEAALEKLLNPSSLSDADLFADI